MVHPFKNHYVNKAWIWKTSPAFTSSSVLHSLYMYKQTPTSDDHISAENRFSLQECGRALVICFKGPSVCNAGIMMGQTWQEYRLHEYIKHTSFCHKALKWELESNLSIATRCSLLAETVPPMGLRVSQFSALCCEGHKNYTSLFVEILRRL